MRHKQAKLYRRIFIPLAVVAFLLGVTIFLQFILPHQFHAFVPLSPQTDLTVLWDKPVLADEDYAVFLSQTGLNKPGIDDLREKGDVGYQWLLDIQTAFFAPRDVFCRHLGFVTREERLRGTDGKLTYGGVLTPLQNGDILLSFSTHSYGWRHGHAGLVVDAAKGTTLEAAVWGSPSGKADANFWRTYSTYMVLRPKNITPQLQKAVSDFALKTMDGVPYHLTAGVFGDKAPDPTEDLSAQCAYLIWYAYQNFDLDLDSDGGRVVTVNDLANSDLLDVVQVYGFDPTAISNSHPSNSQK